MSPTEFSNFDLNQEEDQVLDNLMNILFDMKIIEPPQQMLLDQEIENNYREELELLVYNAFLESSIQEEVEESEKNEANFQQNLFLPCLPYSGDSEGGEAAFEKLQQLLVGEELGDIKQNLTKLEHQIYNPQALISLLLPWINEILKLKIADSKGEIVETITPIVDHAIRSRTQQDKASMGSALAAVLPLAISEQIKVEQDSIVDALYPIIGNTIAKYMAETIYAINQKIEETLSPEGIKRKIHAKLQGVSEAELILKEAIPFTIQAIFLIHKVSGLVISEVQSADAHPLESDMLAGMLTAIRSFANDCIMQSGNISELDAIDYGTSKIILEVAGYCYLAIIIQGKISKRFIVQMRKTLSTIVKDYGRAIENFDGDSATIPEQIHTYLQNLKNQYSQIEKKKNQPPALLILTLTIMSVIFTPLGIWQYRNHVIHSVENKIMLNLASTPELAVYRLNVKESRRKLKLTGQLPNQFLRHHAEEIAQTTASKWKIDNQILIVEVPADPVLTAAEVKRVSKVLNQIDGVAISTTYIANQVTVKGTITPDIDRQMINNTFEQIPGVKSVSTILQMEPLQIETRFYFQPNSATLAKADLEDKLQSVKLFLNQHPNKALKIIGYSYSVDHQITEQQLAIARAKAVQQALINEGTSPSRLHVVGLTSLPPGIDISQPLWLQRCVVMEVITSKKLNNN